MTDDLSDALQSWPGDPFSQSVRELQAADGRPLIQVRLDLGILQMERSGRPDGTAVHGHQTALAAWDAGDCGEHGELLLRAEFGQFHTRGRALMILGHRREAAQDGEHLVNIAARLANTPSTHSHSLMPAAITFRAHAGAEAAISDSRTDLARIALESGLRELQQVLNTEEFQRSPEAALLRSMIEAFTPRLPSSQRAELEARLQDAISQENYELAAILRNELRMMR